MSTRKPRSRILRLARTTLRLIRRLPIWAGEYFRTPPIIVMSFNRPHYLRPTLESLRHQKPGIDHTRIHLFQDGAVNRYSGTRYADDAEIEQCIALFREIFPRGHLHISQANIGICENFLRAEQFAFEVLKAPVAYFFEDDMVLSPHYVAALDTLRRALCGRRVGYFNAFGSFASSIEEQTARREELTGMHHLWGFGLKRSHWLAMQPILKTYYRLVTGRDYRHRPAGKILAFYRRLGFPHTASSQDGAKAVATQVVKGWRASTFPCFAQYIGKEGTHFSEAIFEELGFHNTNIYPGPLGRVKVRREQIKSGLVKRERNRRKPASNAAK